MSYQHGYRVFHILFECLQECRAYGAIHAAVIATEGDLHDLGDGEFVVPAHHYFLDAADGQNAAVRWINDGGKFFYVHHAQVGNGKGVPAEFLGL